MSALDVHAWYNVIKGLYLFTGICLFKTASMCHIMKNM